MESASNVDSAVVRAFGEEWSYFDQANLSKADFQQVFASYFKIFPWDQLPAAPRGFDLGCGSGRWARGVAPRVGELHCIDASSAALTVARRNLAAFSNVELHCASVDAMPIADGSMDFGYSLGVLHHVPDTSQGIRSCVSKLKAGAPFLVYLYYAFDNKPAWFRAIWRLSDLFRRLICRLPFRLKNAVCIVFAASVYLPLARLTRVLELAGTANKVLSLIPLSQYRDKSFYTMRTDSLDRFGTRLEQRFTADQIRLMMEDAGLERVQFSPAEPFWCAVGYRKPEAAVTEITSIAQSSFCGRSGALGNP